MKKTNRAKKLGLGAALVLPLAMLAGYATYAVIKPTPAEETVEAEAYADLGTIDFVNTGGTPNVINTTSATIYYDYTAGTNDTDLKYRVYKNGTTPPSTWQSTDISAQTDGEYSLTFTNLTPATNYTVQAYISDGVNSSTMYSMTFLTADAIAGISFAFTTLVEYNTTEAATVVDGTMTYTVTKNESAGTSVEYKLVEDTDNDNIADSGETAITPTGGVDSDSDGYYNTSMTIDGTQQTVSSIYDEGYEDLKQNTNYVIDFQIDNFHSPSYHFVFKTGVVGTVSGVADDNDVPTLHNTISVEYNYTPNASAGDVEYQIYEGTNNTGTVVKAWSDTAATEDNDPNDTNTAGQEDDSNATYDTYSLNVTALDDSAGDADTDPDAIKPSTNYYVEFKVDGTITGGGSVRTKDEPQYEKIVNGKALTYSDTTVVLEYGITAGNQGAPADVQYRIYETASAPTDEATGWLDTPQQDVSANTYTMTLTGLKPNTAYTVQIGCDVASIPGVIDSPNAYPDSSTGATGTIQTITFTTAAAGTVGDDVFSAEVDSTTDTSATISYDYIAYDETNSTPVEYRIITDANANGTVDTGEDTVPAVDWTVTTPVETANGEYTISVTGLSADTDYIAQFSTDGGTTADTNSNVAFTTSTAGAVPASISNVTSEKVTDTTAEIKYYYEPNDNTASDDVKFTVRNAVTGAVIGTANTSTTATETAGAGWYTISASEIGTLTANTEYLVELSLGGTILNTVYFTTAATGAVPASIDNVTVTGTTSNAATISFVYEAGSTTADAGEGVVEFQVNNHGWVTIGEHSSGSDANDLTDGATETFTINTLNYGTTYRINFRVDGVVQTSEVTTVTTSGQRATLTSATAGTATATTQTITYVVDNTAAMAPGVVSYSLDGGITWTTDTNADTNSTIELTGLTASTYYEVMVTVDGHVDEIIIVPFYTIA